MSANIKILRSQTARRMELKSLLKDLEGQIEPLEKDLFQLYITAHNEQADVDNLESTSLKNWFLDVTGKKEALMNKERQEAQAAKLHYDTAKRQLDWVHQELSDIRRELNTLTGCACEYWAALEATGDKPAMAAHLENVIKELKDAVDAANEVFTDTEKILNNVLTLNERNQYGSGSVNMMMPSYLASEQKRINLLARKIGLLVEEFSNLPVDKPILEPGSVLIDIDEHLLDELMSTTGRDAALGQAERSLRNTLKALRQLLEAVEAIAAQKEDQLAELKNHL